MRVRPATPDRWSDVVAVMGIRGDPSSCWCQYYRLSPEGWRRSTVPANRDALQDQVDSGPVPPGVVAYVEDEPVGWCAVGPKEAYPRVVASRTSGADVAGIWSVSCFVVRVGHRRRGVAGALLGGAVELARDRGAAAVAGYPVDPAMRRSVSSAELFHGPLGLFLAAGFTEVARLSPARAVVRLEHP